MPETITPGVPAKKRRMRALDAFLAVMVVLVLLALLGVFGVVSKVAGQLDAQEQRGYKTRAVICDMVQALGLTPNPECSDRAIQPYRDKDSATKGTTGARNSKATLDVVCRLAAAQDVLIPECA